MIDLQRHNFVWLNDDGWSQLLPQNKHEALLQWQKCDWPLIICQQLPSRKQGHIACGLALPKVQGKMRISLEILPKYIKNIKKSPNLAEVEKIIPTSWQNTIKQLLALSRGFQVFGSLAWQYMTGLQYLSATSDCDLIFNIADYHDDLDSFLENLILIQSQAAFQLDCELLNNQAAVHFEELYKNQGQDVLVKTLQGVKIMPKQLWLENRYAA